MPLRIVQVGVSPSGIGAAWLAAIQQSDDWTLAGVVDTSAEHRASAAQRAGLPPERCFAALDDAVRAVDCDAVALIVPSPLHDQLCAQALQAGKHVVVEKPFTLGVEQARTLAALADERGLRLMVDQNYRYLADMRTLRRAVQERVVGAPGFVAVSFDCLHWPGRPYQWAMADTMLLEMAIHHFDSLRFILGAESKTVSGQTWRPRWTRYQGDTVVACQFEFGDGVRVAYRGSLESPGVRTPWQGIWRIECEGGALHLADMGAGYGVYLSRGSDGAERFEPLDEGYTEPGGALRGALCEFAAALREGRRPQSDGRDNIRTLAMACAVSRASATGRTVDVDEEFFAHGPSGS